MKKHIIFLFSALLFSCSQQYEQSIYDKNFDIKPANVSALTLSPNVTSTSASVSLSWELPIAEFSSICVTAYNKNTSQLLFTETLSNKATTWDYYDVNKLTPYRFVVQTVKANGTKSEGITVNYSFDSNVLIDYKSNLKALDFGWTDPASEKLASGKLVKSFTYKHPDTNPNALNLSSMLLKKISGKDNAFAIESIVPEIIEPGAETTITVSYSPDYSAKTWDEAELYYGQNAGTSLKICLIGSTFRQPNNIGLYETSGLTQSHLRLWLRPDFISSENIDNDTRCNKLLDFSGNGFDAVLVNHLQNSLASNPGPIYTKNSQEFNGLPVLQFTNGSLCSTGKICRYTTNMLDNSRIDSEMGTTAFIVYKQTANNGSWFLTSYSGSSYSFPLMGVTSRNFSYNSGYSGTSSFIPTVYGTGMSSNRYFYNPENYGPDKINTPIVAELNTPHVMVTRSVYKNFSKSTKNGVQTNYYFREFMSSYNRMTAANLSLDDLFTTLNYDINKSYTDINYPHLYYYYDSQTRAKDTNTTHPSLYGVPLQNSAEAWYDGKKCNLGFTHSIGTTNKAVINELTDFATGEPWGTSDNNNRINPYLRNGTNLYNVVQFAYKNSGYNSLSAPYYANVFNNNITTNPDQMSISNIYIGKNFTTTTDINVYIADVIIYNKTLSEKEIAEVNNYIYYRWGVGQEMDESGF